MALYMQRIGVLVAVTLFSLVFFGTGLTGAQPIEARVAGQWQLIDEVSGAVCRLHLTAEVAAGAFPRDAFRVDMTSCTNSVGGQLPQLGWRAPPEGGIEFVLANGSVLAAFDVGESEGLASVAPAGAFLLLVPERAVALSALIPTAQ